MDNWSVFQSKMFWIAIAELASVQLLVMAALAVVYKQKLQPLSGVWFGFLHLLSSWLMVCLLPGSILYIGRLSNTPWIEMIGIVIASFLTIVGLAGITTSSIQMVLIEKIFRVKPDLKFGLLLTSLNFVTALVFLRTPLGEVLRTAI